MIARHQKNLTTVLVVDEAHHLSADVLEEIRLLTNLETPQDKAAADSARRTAGTGRETGFGRSAAIEAAHRVAVASGSADSGRNMWLRLLPSATRGKRESW